jgi:hypothetical protein
LYVEYFRDMATPSAAGYKYVELPVHIWYDEKINKYMIASTDPDLPNQRMILAINRDSAAERSARALLAKYGKPIGA